MYSSEHISRLAQLICQESLLLNPGDLVILEGIDVRASDLILFKKGVEEQGFRCLIFYKSDSVNRENNDLLNERYIKALAAFELAMFEQASAIVGLRYPKENQAIASKESRELFIREYLFPVHFEYRNSNLQWVYCRLPSEKFFRRVEDKYSFTEQYFNSIFLSYSQMKKAFVPFVKLLENTQTIVIEGLNTQLSIESSGSGVYSSTGSHNLPDGEVFFSPKRTKVDGRIRFNIPSTYWGHHFSEITLEFENGKVVNAIAPNNEELLSILDIDEGARYCGEFAFGLNPFITHPIDDILYDEKMTGSFHLALGNAYPEADNGNRSGIHWDIIQNMIQDQSKVFFDSQLVIDNGRFVTPELFHLNPKHLQSNLKL